MITQVVSQWQMGDFHIGGYRDLYDTLNSGGPTDLNNEKDPY